MIHERIASDVSNLILHKRHIVNMAARAYATLFRHLKQNVTTQNCRTYLSAAYRCDDVWNRRLENPLVKGIIPSEYYYELDRKHKREGKVSAIDVDLFVNQLNMESGEKYLDEMVDLVHRLRRSKETCRTLPSTPQAVMRFLLDTRNTDTLLKLLSDPINYGVFPDYYMANLMMDTYIKEENFTAAARVASTLMLQEDFGPKLTQSLALASTFLYATSDNNEQWQDYRPEVEQPKEEVKVWVRYLRNPYFDDHFDLTESKHIVGKTLAYVSPLVGGVVGHSCEVLGWALYNKWQDLEAVLSRFVSQKEQVAASVITSVKELTELCEDTEEREKILSSISRLEATGSVVQIDLKSLIEKTVTEAANSGQAEDIKQQEALYVSWEKQREEEVQNQLELYKKRQLWEEIEEKKKQMEAKEEIIFFFDNKEKLEMLLPDKKRKYYPKKKSLIYGKKQPRKVDEGYIPPEVIRR